MKYEYEKMKVKEIRDILQEKFNYSEDDVNEVKGKAALVAMLQEEENDTPLDNIEMDEEDADYDTVSEDEEEFMPRIGSYEWTDYILDKLRDDEKNMIDSKACPTVDGLRRLVTDFVGTIIGSTSEVKQVPSKDEQIATVVHTIVVVDEDGMSRTVSGSADAQRANVGGEYWKFPVAIAETRAEGRALRRLLQLRRVVAAEEMGPKASNSSEMITMGQINTIDILGKRSDADIASVLNILGIKNKGITFDQGQMIIHKLNEYTQGKEEVSCPGYSSNWRDLVK